MTLSHIVRVNIADKRGQKKEVLQSKQMSLPKKLLTFFFGDFCDILVLKPGDSVKGIEIKETGYGGECRA